MSDPRMEMNFCRRCGAALHHQSGVAYKCESGHTIFLNAAACIGVVLLNDKREVLLLERAIEPGKGFLDVPGGFCDGPERFEDAVTRELKEEVGLDPSDYTTPQYVTSIIDDYAYGGEVVCALGVIYVATLVSNKLPVAADDAAGLDWFPLASIPFERVYFENVRETLRKLVVDRSRLPE